MAGIYFHIPFCKQACHYCNFHFSTSLQYKDEMISAMVKEIQLLPKNYLDNEKVETIYFGGGTPSLLNIEDIKTLLSATDQYFNIAQNAEITLEANPDDVSNIKLQEWKLAKINRLSIGIQSFNQPDLEWMNRAHNAGQAFDCITLIKDAGFDNFSADLIYGTPALTNIEWKKNVDILVAQQVPHLSCYALTVEPKTALHKFISLKKSDDIDTDKQSEQFLLLMEWLTAAGYEHYEISNFAKPGYRSKHNSSYWQGKTYIGIGPSAHSFIKNKRRWNISNNAHYIQSLKNNIIPFEEEVLTNVQQLNEYIMTSLRTIEGIDLDIIEKNFGKEIKEKLQMESLQYIRNHKLQEKNHKLCLTDVGKFFADGIAADLFFEEKVNVSFL